MRINDKNVQTLNIRKIASDLGIKTNQYLMSRARLGTPVRNSIYGKLKGLKEGTIILDFDSAVATSYGSGYTVG